MWIWRADLIGFMLSTTKVPGSQMRQSNVPWPRRARRLNDFGMKETPKTKTKLTDLEKADS